MQRAIVILAALLFLLACSDDSSSPSSPYPFLLPDNNDTPPNQDEPGSGDHPNDVKTKWDLPFSEINIGTIYEDFIVSIQQPEFLAPGQVAYLQDDDLVLGIKIGDEVRAYPHRILDWHEIVNDKIGFKAFAVSYCPLTASGVGFDAGRNFEQIARFGVSGFLFNNNLILFDDLSRSRWSQMLVRSVNGVMRGTPAEFVWLLETTWKTWKEMHPQSRVLNLPAGSDLRYDVFPYGDYKVDPFLLFPIGVDDTRFPRKSKAHGIVLDRFARRAKAYPYELFEAGARVINDSVDGTPVVIAGSLDHALVVSFARMLDDGTVLEFTVAPSSAGRFPFAMIDQHGTTWNVWGEAIQGPRSGAKLPQVVSYNAYWFAWGAIFPNLPVYED